MSRMWLRKEALSLWAYHYCRAVKDYAGIRKLITTSNAAYLYCYYVKDRSNVAIHIIDPHYDFLYYRDVKCRYMKDNRLKL